MLNILQRLHLEETCATSSSDSEEDNEESMLSKETIKRLLQKAAVNGGELNVSPLDLTSEELAAFHRAIATGELYAGIQPWDPWWFSEEASQIVLSADGTLLIRPLNEESAKEVDNRFVPAPPQEPIPPLSDLTKEKPSRLLPVHLLDLLYSYCLVLKLYNGDYSSEPTNALSILCAVSSAAGRLPIPDSVNEAMLACIQRACIPPAGLSDSRQFTIQTLLDVAEILKAGRPSVLIALVDLARLVESCSAEKMSKAEKQNLNSLQRKLFYFLAWANEQESAVYSALMLEVGALHSMLTSDEQDPRGVATA